jgi:hypothetical protein
LPVHIDDILVLYMANNEFKRRFTSGILKDRFKSDKEAKRRQIARVTEELSVLRCGYEM